MDELAGWRPLVASTAAITTVLQFLAGSLVCRKYYIKGTTGDSSGFPFICGILSCSLWLRYGWLKNDDTVIVVNFIGSFLHSIYIIVYLYYTIKKSTVVSQIMGMLSIMGVLYVYTIYEIDKEISLQRMGVICCIVTIIFIAAPLTMLVHVIRSRNTEALPFPMIAMSFIVCGLWYFYGIIINDTYMKIPNSIGAILAGLQLSLFLIYPNVVNVPYKKLSQDA